VNLVIIRKLVFSLLIFYPQCDILQYVKQPVNIFMTTKTNTIFSQDFLQKIEALLLEEKERIQAELGEIAKKNPSIGADFEAAFPEYGDEEDENAREIADYTANKPLEETLEKMLRDIEKSLERLQKGNYGICKYCDKPIDEKRLLARPTSSACVSCKKTLTDEV